MPQKRDLIYRLLELKGVTILSVSNITGREYHSMRKVLRGNRKTKVYQQAWADYFGVSRTALFGPKQRKIVHYLMEKEIENKAAQRREELRHKYLSNQAA